MSQSGDVHLTNFNRNLKISISCDQSNYVFLSGCHVTKTTFASRGAIFFQVCLRTISIEMLRRQRNSSELRRRPKKEKEKAGKIFGLCLCCTRFYELPRSRSGHPESVKRMSKSPAKSPILLFRVN